MILRKMQRLILRTARPETFFKNRYKAFKALLGADANAHNAMATLQEQVYAKQNLNQTLLIAAYNRLCNAARDMIEQLLLLSPDSSYSILLDRLNQIDEEVRTKLKQQVFLTNIRGFMKPIDHLHLTDSSHPSFTPEGCRSLHDIIRFTHEKAIQEMFITPQPEISKAAKRLKTTLPFELYLLDLGDGLKHTVSHETHIDISMVRSVPFLALWEGLSDPNIPWSDRPHFDWQSLANDITAEGITDTASANYASYSLLSADYMNLHIKFGYHFSHIDTLCSEDSAHNYILFHFAGGGAELAGRILRLHFLKKVLEKAHFNVTERHDSILAQIKWHNRDEIRAKLSLLGKLLGVTRLMDLSITDQKTAERWADDFLNGKYDFVHHQDNRHEQK